MAASDQPQTDLTLPDGRVVTLWRTPDQQQPANLRAWDAADEMALQHLHDEVRPAPASEALVVGDAFGALTTGVVASGLRAVWWGDSITAWHAAGANLVANGLTPPSEGAEDVPVRWRPLPEDPPPSDVAIVKVPKEKARLEDVLAGLAAALPPGTPVVGAGMTRHVHTSTVEAFERLVGQTTTTRARKKARLLLATVDPSRAPQRPPAHRHLSHGVEVVGLPGVFGAEGLDAGTGLLLAHLPQSGPLGDVVDLGCGTGVVGTVLAARDPGAEVTFTDSSWSATASARLTWAAAHGERPASFLTADGLSALPEGAADLVVVNPPFHQGHEVGDAVAWTMFGDARRVLRPGGRIVVVGNRHLGYHAKLGRLFGDAEVLGADARFVVLAATRR